MFSKAMIIDESKNITAPKGLKLPDGTWVIGVKVDCKEVWSEIKKGNQKGFSIEGIFKLIDSKLEMNKQADEEEILKLLAILNNKIKDYEHIK